MGRESFGVFGLGHLMRVYNKFKWFEFIVNSAQFLSDLAFSKLVLNFS